MLSSRILVPINMFSMVEEVDQTVFEPLFPQTMADGLVPLAIGHSSTFDYFQCYMVPFGFFHSCLLMLWCIVISDITATLPWLLLQCRKLIMSNVSLCFPLQQSVQTVFLPLAESLLDIWWSFMLYGTVRSLLFLPVVAFMHSSFRRVCIFTLIIVSTYTLNHVIGLIMS